MQNENVVDRYLAVLTALDLPQFGWITTKTLIVSAQDRRDIRVSLTGGFAKAAFSIYHKEFPVVLVVSDEVRDVLTQKTEAKFLARAQYHRAAADKKHTAAALADLPTIEVEPIVVTQADAIPAVDENGVTWQEKVDAINSLNPPVETDKVSERLIEQMKNNEAEELRLEELRRTKAKISSIPSIGLPLDLEKPKREPLVIIHSISDLPKALKESSSTRSMASVVETKKTATLFKTLKTQLLNPFGLFSKPKNP